MGHFIIHTTGGCRIAVHQEHIVLEVVAFLYQKHRRNDNERRVDRVLGGISCHGNYVVPTWRVVLAVASYENTLVSDSNRSGFSNPEGSRTTSSKR
jgi:hypothetical protein